MIIFMEDWDKYPDAIVDLSTKNESFLDIVSQYKSMGIKNHAWPLALMDPSLKGINPHDPNLSDLMRYKVAAESKRNPWYYFREVATASAQSGLDASRIRANRGILSLYFCFFAGVYITMLMMIRQSGKSFSMDQLMVYLICIRLVDTDVNLLTRNDKLRIKNIKRLKEIDKGLPPYLRLRGKRDPTRVTSFTCNALNNELQTYLPSASRKEASEIGKGFTSATTFLDEFNFLKNIDETLPSLLPSGAAARDAAKKAGEPHGTVIASTAGSMDTVSGEYGYHMYEDSAEWTEHFMDAKDAGDLEKMVRNNSRSDESSRRGVYRISCVFNHRQLGYTDRWLLDTMEQSATSGAQKLMDFFNKWFSGGEKSPLDRSVLRRINESKKDYTTSRPIGDEAFIVYWNIPAESLKTRLRTAIMCVDTSEAIGKDDIALIIRDYQTGERIGYAKINYANVIKFSEFLFELLKKYPNLTMIMERKNTGSAIMDHLLVLFERAGMDPFKRIFNLVVHKYKEKASRYKEINSIGGYRSISKLADKYHDTFGFCTAGSGEFSRSGLYSEVLVANYEHTGHIVTIPILIGQILGLEIRNNRVDHSLKGKDDFVVADLMGYWFLTKSKNLEHYGIDPLSVLKSIPPRPDKVKSSRSLRKEAKKQRYSKEIAALQLKLEKLPKHSTSITRMRIMSRLKWLDAMLGDKENESPGDRHVHRIEQSDKAVSHTDPEQEKPWYLR